VAHEVAVRYNTIREKDKEVRRLLPPPPSPQIPQRAVPAGR
jgi:hypothetical protein